MSLDFENTSTEELLKLLHQYEHEAHLADKSQHATKILLNSLYGALGTPYFRMYDVHMAEGITLSGQAVVAESYKMFNNYLNTKLGTNSDYVVASDTDSVVGDSVVYVNGSKMTIADFYDMLPGEDEYESGKFVKECHGYKTLTFDSAAVLEKPIKYAMKHKVKKKMYKITVGGQSVIVTEDHSVKAVDVDGRLVDVKPQELDADIHKLVNISSDTDSAGDNLYEGERFKI